MKKIKSFFSKVNSSPIFILGNPKSGTTVIANLLSKATNQSLTSDFQNAIKHTTLQLELDFKLLNFKNFIKQYKYEFSKEIIKEPFLSFYTEELIKSFPNAKFVFIARDPYQNIRSILNRLKIPGNLKEINFEDYDEIIKTPVWKLAMQTNMLGLFSSNYIEAMANRWNYVVNSCLNHPDKIQLVKYEDFLKNKAAFIYDLAKGFELEVVNDIHKKVDIQYQSKGDSEVDLKNFFGAENYSNIEKLCKKNMEELGF
jgi:hypothetical protein